jgi:hypothetical protein
LLSVLTCSIRRDPLSIVQSPAAPDRRISFRGGDRRLVAQRGAPPVRIDLRATSCGPITLTLPCELRKAAVRWRVATLSRQS